MTTASETTKRQMHNPAAFAGKQVDMYTAWIIPDGYATCAMTGKFLPFAQLEVTFNHHLFDKQFLIANGIYVEDADWLSEEGYEMIMDVLEQTGQLDYYRSF